MTDLDDRLTDLLTRSADAVEVRHDLDAVVAGDHGPAPVVDLGRRPRDVRRLLALAAAVLVVLAVVGAVALTAADDEPLGVTDAPPAAGDRFPVFGPLPAGLEDGAPVEAADGEGTHQNAMPSNFHPDTPLVSAAIGRVDDDGSVDDVIALVAGAEGLEDRIGPAVGEVEEISSDYRMASMAANPGWVELYGPGTTVLVVGGPQVTDLVREIAGTGLTATVGPDGRPLLTLGDLPDGYTVTAPPTAPEARQAEIAIDSESVVVDDRPLPPYVLVETGVGEPSLAIAANSAGGSYRPIDVDGSAGFVAAGPDTTVLAWVADNGVTIRLISDLDEDGAMAIARGLTLVDEATWRATYFDATEGPGPEGAETTEPTTTDPDAATDPDATTASAPDGSTAPGPTTPDEAEIDAAFHTAFDADIPEEERFAAVEDGQALVEAGREAVARFPAAADSISVTVHDVEIVAPDRATVVFELLYDGAQLLGRQTGEAVLLDGAWKVTRETRCAIIRRSGVACP